jgi:hypothetical protein
MMSIQNGDELVFVAGGQLHRYRRVRIYPVEPAGGTQATKIFSPGGHNDESPEPESIKFRELREGR